MSYTKDVIAVDYLVQPDSSFIDTVGYANDGEWAYVEMHDTVYAYSGVPYDEFAALATARSVGNYYSTHFRPQYGPAITMNAEFEVREVPVEFVDIEDVISEEAEDVYTTENAVDTDWIERNLRSEALNLAVIVHKGTASDSYSIVRMANSFKEYLNG